MKIVWDNVDSKPPVWTIDGCKFSADIPTYHQALGLQKLLGADALPHPDKMTQPFALRYDARDEGRLILIHPKVAYLTHALEQELRYHPWKDSMQYVDMLADSCIQIVDINLQFRQAMSVVLTPLDENGRDDSWDFKRENPNGLLVYGGTLYIDDQPFPCHGWKWDGTPVPEVEGGSDVRIGDTYDDEHAIRWLAYEGKLVALYPMFDVESADISTIFNGWRWCGKD